ncbi:probable inactive leucine-rich repeat receptor-like protein kinase At1g66830 [Ricinus communis]|uniref:ATP binding protein, putative n=1 Tax=Ricinus communis TaxID=3988 RepID=B9SQ07_RICCO|nr:probable inactive leucine-rich repeat receptor-like protein kinase At1g66830 [Ricinus communis]EEF34326.1 ATP binding protein, putative [Ricinus communis]|eukprot:XP_002528076.1 probable inactive leucine-rich repeat receptor-like protein kinase At1g66830 [Ricinus communis]
MFPLLSFLMFSYILLANSLNDEGLALLSFRQSIENSTAGYLDNWNSSDDNPCSWHGVECRGETVVSLRIPHKGLSGLFHLDATKLLALRQVNLRNNYFFGSLPVELFRARGLTNLVLSGNSFSGSVPDEIGNLKGLKILDLSENSFNGSIPSPLVQCKRLKQLYLSRNNFAGSLPNGFGTNLVMLQILDLSFNKLSGLIPNDLGNLSSLKRGLDLSHNLFNGTIPASLGKLPELVYINLSYNNLSGLIPQNDVLLSVGPTAFVGNPLLCGLPLKSPCLMDPKPIPYEPSQASPGGNSSSRSPTVVIGIVASTVVGVSLTAVLFSYWYKRTYVCKGSKRVEGCNPEEKSSVRKEMFCFRTDDLESLSENMEQYIFMPLDSQIKFDLEQLLKASAFLLSKSRIGIVYKVVLEKGPTVAVRRLEDGGFQRYREFQTEVEAIAKIKHPNIVCLLAYCWCINEKLLIYEYAQNGDLSAAIHGRTGMIYFKPLSWLVRLRIMQGVARGLSFLHEFSPRRYVHGNLKPSNILLGENMEPCISDFGLSRLAYTTEESTSVYLEQTTGGTPLPGSPFAFTPINSGAVMAYYEAPEVSKSSKPSQKWDVYSFGVILLEMISGKSPVMQTSASEMGLVQWIQLSTEVKPLSDVLDPFLVHDLDKKEEMVAILNIALTCVHTSPDKRPSMRNVSDSLERLSSST